MISLGWRLSVLLSRWRHRLLYLAAAPRVYRNWWAMPLPKLGIGVVLELRDGVRYQVRPRSTDLAVVNETALSNPYLCRGFDRLPADADVVDVGANIGDLSMRLARLCPEGRVFAVEPLRDNVRMIGVQKRLNGADNVTIVPLALGGHEGVIDIHADGNASSSLWGAGASEPVRVTTLPQLMKEFHIERIALLKLDCEGAEWSILPAAEGVLERVARIVMEFHCAEGWTPEKLAGWLRDRGYLVHHTAGPWNGLLWAERPVKR